MLHSYLWLNYIIMWFHIYVIEGPFDAHELSPIKVWNSEWMRSFLHQAEVIHFCFTTDWGQPCLGERLFMSFSVLESSKACCLPLSAFFEIENRHILQTHWMSITKTYTKKCLRSILFGYHFAILLWAAHPRCLAQRTLRSRLGWAGL